MIDLCFDGVSLALSAPLAGKIHLHYYQYNRLL